MDAKRAIEADGAKQTKRAIVAGEVAGAWDKFGGLGLQLRNLVSFLEVSVKTNQEAAAKFRAKRNRMTLTTVGNGSS